MGMEKKVTREMAENFAQAHADGVSFRTLGKLYDLAPSLVHRHVTRVNAESSGHEVPDAEVPVPDVPEPQPFPEPPSPARPRPPELEFPDTVPGFEPEPEEGAIDIEQVRPPERAPGQHRTSNVHPLEWAEHNVRTTKQDIAQCRKADLPDKLAVHEQRLAVLLDFIDTWADAYAGLDFYRPLPSETGVRISEQFVSDRRPRALWENPHDHGPRGFTIVGQ